MKGKKGNLTNECLNTDAKLVFGPTNSNKTEPLISFLSTQIAMIATLPFVLFKFADSSVVDCLK